MYLAECLMKRLKAIYAVEKHAELIGKEVQEFVEALLFFENVHCEHQAMTFSRTSSHPMIIKNCIQVW